MTTVSPRARQVACVDKPGYAFAIGAIIALRRTRAMNNLCMITSTGMGNLLVLDVMSTLCSAQQECPVRESHVNAQVK